MRLSRKAPASLVAALAIALLVAACGGDDKKKGISLEDSNPDNEGFHVAADADHFGGPTPMKVRFYSTPFHETGIVHWRWRFDDGTTSEEQNPVHNFPRPGYYQVLMEARDAKGSDAWNLIVGAWPPDVWETRQKTSGPLTSSTIRDLQKEQALRTAKRRKQQLAKTRKRAAQYSSESERPKL
jgi:hypothetical protein